MIFLTLFAEFFKIGLFTFGGAYGMIPIIKEVVISHSWITEEAFYDFIGVCESTPGPIAVNMATYIGSTQAGIFGSICATLGVVLPSFIIILLIASKLSKLTEGYIFQGFLDGARPVVVALIMSTGLILLYKALGISFKGGFSVDTAAVIIFPVLLITSAVYKKLRNKKLSAISLIIISAVLGILVSIVCEKLS